MDPFLAAILCTVALGLAVSFVCGVFARFFGQKSEAPSQSLKTEERKKVAAVRCCAAEELREKKMVYEGPSGCAAACGFFAGDGICPSACLGGGDCAAVCPAKAITIRHGTAVVDASVCTGCGECAAVCPKGLISLVYEGCAFAGCSISAAVPAINGLCSAGCDSCKLCRTLCESGAISFTDDGIAIDSSLCTGCGKCERLCPRHVIHMIHPSRRD